MLFKFFGQVEESFSAGHNLTCTAQNLVDVDGDAVTNITAWYSGSSPLASLFMPFETNTNDYSGNSNDGTNSGGTFVTGTYGNSLSGSSFVSVPHDASLDFTSATSWDLWVKRSVTGGTLFDKTNASGFTNYKLYHSSAGRERSAATRVERSKKTSRRGAGRSA